MSKLKPCPFCGSEAELVECAYEYVVWCKNKLCIASELGSWAISDEIAIEAWNKRAEPEVKVGCWLENTDGTHFCSECHSKAHRIVFGVFFTENLDDYCYKCGAKMEREQND